MNININYISKNFVAYWLFTKLKFKKIISFKTNLIFQTVGMFLNNLASFSVWILLLNRFGNINGYSIKEIMLIHGFCNLFFF